jgi:hypothetical protein
MAMKILIVDDDPDIRDILKLTLSEENYVVLEAKDGEEALKVINAKPLDLILLDYKIPKIDTSTRCRTENATVALKKRPNTFQSDFKNASKFTFSLAIPSFLLMRVRCLRTVWTEVLNVAAISLQLNPFLTMWQISSSRGVRSR